MKHWFNRKWMNFNTTIQVRDVYFWGLQHGPNELEFQTKLTASSKFKTLVYEAYLVRVRYLEKPAERVALCLVVNKDDENEVLNIVNPIFTTCSRRKAAWTQFFSLNRSVSGSAK